MSSRTIFLLVISSTFFNILIAQQLLPDGNPYFCVPAGICPSTGGIDPRIITPDGTPTPGVITCPTGTVPCYAQGDMSTCGQSTIPQTEGNVAASAHPWQAYLESVATGAYLGTGSLLSPYHVLTAAHKVLAFVNSPAQLRIYLGVSNPATRSTSPNSVAAQIRIFNATTYDNTTLKNDIAIVRLATPIPIGQNNVNTICIPGATTNSTTYTATRQRCVVSGYGQIQPTNTAVPTVLKQVFVNTTDINTCETGFQGRVNTAMYLDKTGGQLCAGGEAQKDACFQDGGGPLTCGLGTAASRYTVAGIVIWGKSCGQPGVYGVYTNVPTYRAWLVGELATPIP